MGFQHQSKNELSRLGSKVGLIKRNANTQRAWALSEVLKKQFENGKPAAIIADEQQVHIRTIYRIVRGK